MPMNTPCHASPASRCAAPILALSLLLVGAGTGLRAEVSTVSPFLPPGGAPTGGQEGGALEFRGVMVANGESYFNILDTSSKKSAWVSINQGGRDYVVRSYDISSQTDAVVVDYQGRQIKLVLVKPKTGKAAGAPIAPQAGAMGPRPMGPNQQGPVSPVVLNPTPADEAKRLEDFRNEVLRRRLQRQQDADQKSGSAQPPPPPPQGGQRAQ